MCALDPLLLIPRIEYVQDIHDFVLSGTKAYCLVILDMKNFHIVNDEFGYDVGDDVISRFISRLRERLPPGSISLRFRHGDEFLFFLPESMSETRSLFESFRDSCEATPIVTAEQHEIFVSYRFAVLPLERGRGDIHSLLKMAENALREVKGSGSPRL